MKKKRMLKTESLVKEILEQDPFARDDDNYLMLQVLIRLAPDELGKTYKEVLLEGKKNPVSFKTVERNRRKVQAKYPELQASTKTRQARLENEEVFKEYALDV